ncbi:hypothetical protein NEISICOT_00811 [Neisseria sicca ATCC 29256]|uniref:Uncharacterized protein n=1 Tax=Neisseria sicca ATCC 29256 TaxID=547045 RepID=C6M2S3_NEISI|nr:hypothetical protein NEISICOT_00811 [Neisseria sicca ATCC 29256]
MRITIIIDPLLILIEPALYSHVLSKRYLNTKGQVQTAHIHIYSGLNLNQYGVASP